VIIAASFEMIAPQSSIRGQRRVKFSALASLARPGGNLTGLSAIALDLEGKRLELLRDVAPKLSHVAMFMNSLTALYAVSVQQAPEPRVRGSLEDAKAKFAETWRV